MIILTVIFSILAFIGAILLFLKYRIVLSGELMDGEIIGYSKPMPGGILTYTYNYKVQFDYHGETVECYSAESFSYPRRKEPDKHYYMKVQVYYNPKKSADAVIKNFKETDISSGIFMVVGLIGVIGTLLL